MRPLLLAVVCLGTLTGLVSCCLTGSSLNHEPVKPSSPVKPQKDRPQKADPKLDPLDLDSCTTVCGLKVSNISKGSCVALNQAEAHILFEYTQNVSDFHNGLFDCLALDGWHLDIRSTKPDPECENGWLLTYSILAPPMCVIGYTHELGRFIEVQGEDWTHNALTHELGHVLDMAIHYKGVHCAWEKRGFVKAIKAVTGKSEKNFTEYCGDDP